MVGSTFSSILAEMTMLQCFVSTNQVDIDTFRGILSNHPLPKHLLPDDDVATCEHLWSEHLWSSFICSVSICFEVLFIWSMYAIKRGTEDENRVFLGIDDVNVSARILTHETPTSSTF